MELTELAGRLRAAVSDFLWDQWVAFGLAGHPIGRPVPFVIDPEALLLATLRFGVDDARFRGEVLDWLARNGVLLSVQRIKNLARTMQVAPPEHVRGLSAFMTEAGHPNWKTLGAEMPGVRATDLSGLTLRGMSQPPDSARPEAFLLRMRLIFGVNSRAEVITWLLTHADGHAARIARDTGWFSKSVQAILNDLEQAGTLVSRPEGKRKDYALNPRARFWHLDLGTGLRWFTQPTFYTGAFQVLNLLEATADPETSSRSRAIAIRRELAPLEAALGPTGLGALFAGAQREHGDALVQTFEEGTAALIQLLETRSELGESTVSA